MYLFFIWFYKKLSYTERISILLAERSVCAIQSVCVVTGGVLVMWETQLEMIYFRSKLYKPIISFIFPYIIYDLVAMYISYIREKGLENSISMLLKFIKSEFLIVFHHVGILAIGYPIALDLYNIRRGFGDFVLGSLMLMDISNFFWCTRRFLKVFYLEETKFYFWNQIFFIITFFLCRILSFPLLFLKFCLTYQVSLRHLFSRIPSICFLTVGFITFVQMVWLVKLVNNFVGINRTSRNRN